MKVGSTLFQAISPIVDSMKGASLYANNNSSIIAIEGDINEIINLPQKLAGLGYRLNSGIRLTLNAHYFYPYLTPDGKRKSESGKRTNGVATFIHDEQFQQLISSSK